MIDLIIEIIRGSKNQKEVKACLTKGDVGNIRFQSYDSMIEATKLSFTDKQASNYGLKDTIELIQRMLDQKVH